MSVNNVDPKICLLETSNSMIVMTTLHLCKRMKNQSQIFGPRRSSTTNHKFHRVWDNFMAHDVNIPLWKNQAYFLASFWNSSQPCSRALKFNCEPPYIAQESHHMTLKNVSLIARSKVHCHRPNPKTIM